MQFRLTKRFAFEASHQLMHHDGKCRNLHGHSWRGAVEVVGKELEQTGPKKNMLVDYSVLGMIADTVETEFDHKHLNDVVHVDMPTSEIIAKEIFGIFRRNLTHTTLRVVAVTIEETCSTACRYEEEQGGE